MSETDISLPRNSETSLTMDGEKHVTTEGDAPAAEAAPHRVGRRRSSSGGSKHEHRLGFEPEHKASVEFVRPIEGTPAAEALAGSLIYLFYVIANNYHNWLTRTSLFVIYSKQTDQS